jgi:hypothetical protein
LQMGEISLRVAVRDEEKVPTRVGVFERVVETVRVPVKVLRIERIRDYRVSTDEPPDRGVVVPGTMAFADWWASPTLRDFALCFLAHFLPDAEYLLPDFRTPVAAKHAICLCDRSLNGIQGHPTESSEHRKMIRHLSLAWSPASVLLCLHRPPGVVWRPANPYRLRERSQHRLA